MASCMSKAHAVNQLVIALGKHFPNYLFLYAQAYAEMKLVIYVYERTRPDSDLPNVGQKEILRLEESSDELGLGLIPEVILAKIALVCG